MMLQRRLNNDGSQNASFAQERLHSFYSTPPGGPKSPPQKILNARSLAVRFLKFNIISLVFLILRMRVYHIIPMSY